MRVSGEILWLKLLVKYCTKLQGGERAQSVLNYLGPSFSNILGPCSCHSCFVIHIFSLSAIYCIFSVRTLVDSRL